MTPIVVAILVPLFVVGLLCFLRWLHGDGIFGLAWPGHDLDNPDDFRLNKLKLPDPPPGDRK